MHKRLIPVGALLALVCPPLAAQVAVPGLRDTVGTVARLATDAIDPAIDTVADLPDRAQSLAQRRIERLSRLVRQQRALVDMDRDGQPARKGVLLISDPPADLAQRLEGSGFREIGRERLADIDVEVVQVAVPPGMGLSRAQDMLRDRLPGVEVGADNLLFPGGSVSTDRRAGARPVTAYGTIAGPVGVIDGGAAGAVEAQRGFATGAPVAGNHGSAVVLLLHGAGVRRVLVADVYGSDPAGGNALAIARAFDWLVGQGVRVVSISLVGPANPLLARAIAGAQRRGTTIVAPVGNDGPAAPPAYPASFPGVLAVTGVDGRNRPLIEAGRALHLDYAAPAADMRALDMRGRRVPVRGTSFAVPLVAARTAAAGHANVRDALDREAVDLGPRGPDATYGRGLICGPCRG